MNMGRSDGASLTGRGSHVSRQGACHLSPKGLAPSAPFTLRALPFSAKSRVMAARPDARKAVTLPKPEPTPAFAPSAVAAPSQRSWSFGRKTERPVPSAQGRGLPAEVAAEVERRIAAHQITRKPSMLAFGALRWGPAVGVLAVDGD